MYRKNETTEDILTIFDRQRHPLHRLQHMNHTVTLSNNCYNTLLSEHLSLQQTID